MQVCTGEQRFPAASQHMQQFERLLDVTLAEKDAMPKAEAVLALKAAARKILEHYKKILRP